MNAATHGRGPPLQRLQPSASTKLVVSCGMLGVPARKSGIIVSRQKPINFNNFMILLRLKRLSATRMVWAERVLQLAES
jgi:hypothetical protein